VWDTVFGVEQVFSEKELKQLPGFFKDSGQKIELSIFNTLNWFIPIKNPGISKFKK
jgi:hypothetical protein